MELLSSKILISPIYTKFPAAYSLNPLQIKTLRTNSAHLPLTVHCKKSKYPDFQEYVKPVRLLQASEVKVCTDALAEKTADSFMSGRSESLYKVRLQTSKVYGSGLNDISSGVLLCLIDENGSSILQRLPAASIGNDAWTGDGAVKHDIMHFERGAIDEFAFEGPKLAKIVAFWVSVESGQWRVGGLNLTVIYRDQASPAENNQSSKQQTGLCYTFEVEDILLGEKNGISMMEFRPQSVTAFSGEGFTLFDNNSSSHGFPSVDDYPMSNEESMKEYADLKFSLLFYDATLVLVGSSITALLAGENTPYAFLTGGMCGFLYLLLLQKSVDGLSTPELVPNENEEIFGRIFGRLKGPISSLFLAFAFGIITVRYASGENAINITPPDLIFGMIGFLMSKVSVLLAAFMPIPLNLREN